MRRLTFLLLLLPCAASADLQKTTLKAAMDAGLVSISAAASADSYNGKGLRLEIKNLTKNTLQVKIDPALIFHPADSAMQDLLLPNEDVIAIAPQESAGQSVQTFCAKSYAHSPKEGMAFLYSRQGDSMLIKVSRYIRQNNLYNDLGQRGVWALTNHHSLEGIYSSEDPAAATKLTAYIAKVTGWKLPDYRKEYQTSTISDEPVEAPHVLKIYSTMEWKLDTASRVSLGIYNAAGTLVQPVLEEKEMKHGGYRINVEFEARAAHAGKYYIRLMQNGRMKKEQEIIVD